MGKEDLRNWDTPGVAERALASNRNSVEELASDQMFTPNYACVIRIRRSSSDNSRRTNGRAFSGISLSTTMTWSSG